MKISGLLLATLLTVRLVAGAHELEDNRATLVLRDDNHVTLTLFINYVDALHAALAPGQPLPAFLLVYSAMKPADFRAALDREIGRAHV